MAETLRRVRVALGAGRGYDVRVGAGALDALGEVTRRAAGEDARRVAVVSNARVFKLYGARALASLRAQRFTVTRWLMPDGERFKTLRTAERALAFLAESEIERGDAVVALGGGVVGDLAGFAAALHLRGVAVVQVPTTLVAQVDASVGGKTAVNTPAGKNLVGVFHQPRAVLADTDTLATLRPRELTSGWCEAVKHGAVGDRELFERTKKFLEEGRDARDDGRRQRLADLVAAHCAFKAKIVAGDEREDSARADARSRRVLNFGHTVGHALEAATRYGRFRHGEAVGYGMLAAAEISFRLGMLARTELESLGEAVRLAGRLPPADGLDPKLILRILRTDKKRRGGRARWVLLEGIGRARVVDGREVPASLVRAATAAALRR
ncbi:MAG TPA: 3-dehydroquinate synthase [Pyrinomonadaceae bacterium]|nr:3-dehydroquinate synthase [Pyrinomonadaceae bacterium]